MRVVSPAEQEAIRAEAERDWRPGVSWERAREAAAILAGRDLSPGERMIAGYVCGRIEWGLTLAILDTCRDRGVAAAADLYLRTVVDPLVPETDREGGAS
jgi:hypothetical protein